jgi:hypothetical protein
MHSPVATHFTVIAAHTVAVAATHHPFVTHTVAVAATHHPVGTHAVVVAVTHHPVTTHLTVVGLRLVAAGSLIPLLLGVLVRLGRSYGLRSCNRSFSFLLGETR